MAYSLLPIACFFPCLIFIPPDGNLPDVNNIVQYAGGVIMALRYEDVSETVMEMYRKVKSQFFPELKNAKIRVLFDLKKRKSGGRVVVGRIMKSNDLVRHLTKNANAEDGYDFIITLDRKCWDHITDEDRVKILRHELRHISFDIESDDNPYKLVNHSILDFYEEVEMNQNDPRWRERVVTLTEDIYEQEKEARLEKKKKAGS